MLGNGGLPTMVQCILVQNDYFINRCNVLGKAAAIYCHSETFCGPVFRLILHFYLCKQVGFGLMGAEPFFILALGITLVSVFFVLIDTKKSA